MRMLPRIPAQREPSRIAILPISLSCDITSGVWSENDSVSTKIDIVNPIPPKHATANSIFQFAPSGMEPTLVLTAMKLARVIPMGLRRRRPWNFPRLTLHIPGVNWKMLIYEGSVI